MFPSTTLGECWYCGEYRPLFYDIICGNCRSLMDKVIELPGFLVG